MSRTGRVFSILCFCLCISGVVGVAQEPAGEAAPLLTLDEAIRIAQEDNRSIKNAILAASIAADRTAEARTYRFPSIDLYALGSQLLTPLDFRFEQGTFGTFPGIGPVPATDTNIHTPLKPTLYGIFQVTQPLSQQHKIGLNIRLAKLNEKLNAEKLRAQKQLVGNQVKQAAVTLQVGTQVNLPVNDLI